MSKVALLATLAVFGFGVFGCGSGSGGSADSSTTTTGGSTASKGTPVKIGFIVKSMADSWFQNETDFAKEKAKELGADLTVQEAKDGSAVLTTIDTMGTNGVQGLIICSPEVQLGEAIKKACERNKMKLMSVDDRLLGSDGKPLADVPHLGISAANIGKQAGKAIADEIKKRGWKPEEVAAIAVVVPGLETAKQRADGAKESLTAAGFKAANVFEAPWTGAKDIASASDAANAVLTAHANFKKWVVFSSNDDGVLGAIRSISNRGIPVTDIIGVGINGPLAAEEWAKGQPSGMLASVMLQPKVHGAGTVDAMAKWIRDGTEPAKETYTTGMLIDKTNYKQEMEKQGIKVK